MTINDPQMQTIYLVAGFLIVSNLGTFLTLILKSQSKKDKAAQADLSELRADIKALNARLSELQASIAKLEAVLEIVTPQVMQISKLKQDVDTLWSRFRANN